MQSEYAKDYEALWRDHWWWQARKQFVLHRLRLLHARHAPLGADFRANASPRRILDIGCGNGLFFDDLQAFGEVRGIEPDQSLVSEEGPHRRQIDVRPFDSTFQPAALLDLVLMLDVLEHLEDDLAAARHVREILAPGGVFLLTVPALMVLWSEHDEANLHYRRYTRATLRSVLTAAGFRVESVHYFFGWTLMPLLLRRLLSPARALPKGAGEGSTVGGGGGYRVKVPSPAVNRATYALSRLEQLTIGRWGTPLGSSLIAVAVKEE